MLRGLRRLSVRLRAVRMQRCVLSVFFVSFCVGSVSSLFFLLTHGEQRCFTQHMPEQTLLIGDYRTQIYDEQEDRLPDLHMRVVFKDPDDQLLLSQSGSEGSFRFTSQKPGAHQICLQASECPLSAGLTLAVHLDIKVGEQTNNYTEIARQNKLTMLQLAVERLTEEARHILREQEYQRFREKRFREVDHNTNMWIFWWPVVRSLYVVSFIMVITNSC